nr:FAD-binding oxidoreductase [uncultured Desulfobacter sp.]
MANKKYDVVVIGGGIIGVSTALFLARKGISVCVVEKNIVGQQSSGRAAGNICQSHRPPVDLPIVTRSIEIFEELAAGREFDFEFRRHGNIRLAVNQDHAKALKEMVAREQKEGINCRYISKDETHAIVPDVADHVYLGSVHAPTDGSAEPFKSTWLIADEAKKQGAVIMEHLEVKGFDIETGKITAVKTADGPISCNCAVNTAGAWSAQIGAMAGINVPVEAKLSHLFVTEALPHFLGPVLSTDLYGYFRQTLSGNVLIGYAAKSVDEFKYDIDKQALETAMNRASIIIPKLRNASIIRAFTGFTTWTPDSLPIIGPAPGIKGLFLACAFCGMGFSDGPAVGEAVAEFIADGKTALPIDAFRIERFNQPMET